MQQYYYVFDACCFYVVGNIILCSIGTSIPIPLYNLIHFVRSNTLGDNTICTKLPCVYNMQKLHLRLNTSLYTLMEGIYRYC